MKTTDPDYVNVLSMHDTGPAPEAAIGRDIIRRGAIVALGWGADGAWSAAYGLVLILANYGLAAWLVSYTAKISYALMMGMTLFGYIIRLAIIAAAVYLVRNLGWVELVPMGVTIIVAHVGLLFWELRYVSLSLAYPGLKPKPQSQQESPSAQANSL
jgi:hypothetical protein